MYFQAQNNSTGELSPLYTYRCGAESYGEQHWPNNFTIVGGPQEKTLEEMVRGPQNNCD